MILAYGKFSNSGYFLRGIYFVTERLNILQTLYAIGREW